MLIHTGKEKRYNGKCKCGAHFSTLAVRVQTAGPVIGPVAFRGSPFAEFEAVGRSFSESAISSSALRYKCACGVWQKAEPVRGTFNPEKKCSARCTSAAGHDCECACGGKNHGSQC